mmetsp:Transcript_34837/g.91681  ORF Transcript_34837/g.91681 Transcript_34837/m.91681 type:complete len:364 (-) Transcript_34837:99-1190(-)
MMTRAAASEMRAARCGGRGAVLSTMPPRRPNVVRTAAQHDMQHAAAAAPHAHARTHTLTHSRVARLRLAIGGGGGVDELRPRVGRIRVARVHAERLRLRRVVRRARRRPGPPSAGRRRAHGAARARHLCRVDRCGPRAGRRLEQQRAGVVEQLVVVPPLGAAGRARLGALARAHRVRRPRAELRLNRAAALGHGALKLLVGVLLGRVRRDLAQHLLHARVVGRRGPLAHLAQHEAKVAAVLALAREGVALGDARAPRARVEELLGALRRRARGRRDALGVVVAREPLLHVHLERVAQRGRRPLDASRQVLHLHTVRGGRVLRLLLGREEGRARHRRDGRRAGGGARAGAREEGAAVARQVGHQ